MTDTIEISGCGCAACMAAASNGGDTSVAAAGTVVYDYTALLAYQESSNYRWNGMTDLGTSVVVTYSFTETADLPLLADYDPYGATAYWSYTETQRQHFRDAMAEFEAISGVTFLEVEGTAMVNAFGADVAGVGGWANYANSSDGNTGQGYFVNAYQNMAPGDYGYQVILHEMGHALGLAHPHTGTFILDGALDTQTNSVMTYNIDYPYTTELGVFDIQALQHVYGDGSATDGWIINVNALGRVAIRTTDLSEVIVSTDQTTVIVAKGGDDLIIGREWAEIAMGQDGNDTIWGYGGIDSLRGGLGDDLIYGDSDSDFSGDDDVLLGHAGNDTMYGGGGNDRLIGGGHSDWLQGGYGDDRLVGQSGNDTMIGGEGADIMIGGAGADVFVFDWYDLGTSDRIVDFEVGVDKLDFSVYGVESGLQYVHLDIDAYNGVDTMISVSGWNLSLHLRNVTPDELSASDFLFA